MRQRTDPRQVQPHSDPMVALLVLQRTALLLLVQAGWLPPIGRVRLVSRMFPSVLRRLRRLVRSLRIARQSNCPVPRSCASKLLNRLKHRARAELVRRWVVRVAAGLAPLAPVARHLGLVAAETMIAVAVRGAMLAAAAARPGSARRVLVFQNVAALRRMTGSAAATFSASRT